MVTFRHGDLFGDGSEAVVNTVNCVGVMGKGVALQFKRLFPGNFRAYKAACKAGEVKIGKMFLYDNGGLVNPKWIVNFPTKRDWREVSKLDYIADGLDDLARLLHEIGAKSVSIPPLGCGLGRLNWRAVKPLIEQRLAPLAQCSVIVHEPGFTAREAAVPTTLPEMTLGRASLLKLAWEYLSAMMSPFVTLLEIHKLMYFLQEEGQDLRLRFAKAPHGPYAENLAHVLRRIEGHFIFGYSDGINNPDKPITIAPGIMKVAEAKLADDEAAAGRIRAVMRLCRGFETPDGLELLASVHWLMSKEGRNDVCSIVEGLREWSAAKGRFSQGDVEVAAARIKTSGRNRR